MLDFTAPHSVQAFFSDWESTALLSQPINPRKFCCSVPRISIHHNSLNPAAVGRLPEEREPYDCLTSVRQLSLPHSAVLVTLTENPDLVY